MRKTHAMLAMAGLAMAQYDTPYIIEPNDLPDLRIKRESGGHYGFRNKQGQRPTKKKTGRYFARKAKHKKRLQTKKTR